MGSFSAKYDLPVHEKFMVSFFCIGGCPSIYCTCLVPSDFFFGMKCVWTLKNKIGIGIRI